MMEFSLWKKLKQKLRRTRRPMWQLGCLLAVAMLSLAAGVRSAQAQEQAVGVRSDEPAAGMRSVIEVLASQSDRVTVKLHRVFLCGEEMKALGSMSSEEALGLLKQHPGWTAVLDAQQAVVMEERIDDLSDSCKQNGTFSMDRDGNLSLYDGSPKKEKVLRTFFQLDVNYMESSLPKDRIDELVNGIRITDKDEYNSVLSTFSDYAMDRSEKVMKRDF
ncbi:BofC C-terminal domain-containing protein [Paenibacillus silvisoli]|uniref:BofC C-terminal domain-containing protein n=1 Tax=Paenibacillus silvisoli TaxID=3110539 RepID=UPI0028059A65|nr:BofC C-terminal domain-containing protein [Paenibacillus silvisoli]